MALGLAPVAALLTLLYLRPLGADVALNVVLAALVLLVPLRPPYPLTPRRVNGLVAVWVLGGLLGGFFFGLTILLAGLLVAVVRVGELVLARVAG